ncbi:hypothetical protein M2271_002477 [Streptomyces sp. LBL]|nr:hypothetical protein [Streptomyces sp. LBL]
MVLHERPRRATRSTGTSLPEDLSSLISEDDRDAAVQRLRVAYAEGHISHEELDERLHQVLTAKTTNPANLCGHSNG